MTHSALIFHNPCLDALPISDPGSPGRLARPVFVQSIPAFPSVYSLSDGEPCYERADLPNGNDVVNINMFMALGRTACR